MFPLSFFIIIWIHLGLMDHFSKFLCCIPMLVGFAYRDMLPHPHIYDISHFGGSWGVRCMEINDVFLDIPHIFGDIETSSCLV